MADTRFRNNIHVVGEGAITLVLAHGFGCDQNMWRLLVPRLQSKFRLVLFDYVGSGGSDQSAYDSDKYATLDGYAEDLVDVAHYAGDGPRVLVAHSVSAMIGLLADRRSPGLFDAHVMIGPSPSYINEGNYVGGFERRDIDELLETLDANYLGWASGMAPIVMGAPDQPALSEDLKNSFCRTDPQIAARFARATFLGDNRADLPHLAAPVLVLQSTDDLIAPLSVGQHVSSHLPDAQLRLVDNIGHCPHLSAPQVCADEIEAFIDRRVRAPAAS